MRFFFLPLCLSIAACSSDPAAPLDSGLPPGDIATEIAAWIDTGTPTDDRAALPDFGPQDVGLDVSHADAGVDAVTKDRPFEDRPAPMDVALDTGCTELFCGGRCVESNALNCGSCGNVCMTTLPHTRPACVGTGPDGGAACEWGCEPGWLNCNAMAADGCEYDVRGGGSCR